MIILIAVLALVVVNALRGSPWGLFTIAATIPIAFLMGWWMKAVRPGNVLEVSIAGGVLLIAGLVGGIIGGCALIAYRRLSKSEPRSGATLMMDSSAETARTTDGRRADSELRLAPLASAR